MIRRAFTLLAVSATLAVPCAALAQTAPQTSATHAPGTPAADPPGKPSVFIQAQDGFDTALTAAFIKKQVPANVVTEEDNATYTLKSADVDSKSETTGSKVVRCLLADCIGIEGTASVSVQLIRNADHAVVWAYQVRKPNSGPAGIQSLSEAIAKHLRNDYLDKQK